MHHTKITSGILGAALFLVAFPACAQVVDNREVIDRMNKLEHDIMVLQRQEARGGNGGGIPPEDAENPAPAISASNLGPDAANPASVEVHLSNIEDELRKLRGRVEENEFQARQLADKLSKFQQDTEFRLNEMTNAKAAETKTSEAKAGQAAQTPAAPAETQTPVPPVDTSSEARPSKEDDNGAAQTEETTAGNGALQLPSEDKEGGAFDTPRDQYNYAFRLLNQTRYEDAARYFKDFTGKYPHDPLIGNAYYWLGETYYIRHDYVKAGDSFRQGFEVLPSGPKAADNLLKLSMSLAAMNKNKDACVVLDQLLVKFKETTPGVAQKASTERTRLGCK